MALAGILAHAQCAMSDGSLIKVPYFFLSYLNEQALHMSAMTYKLEHIFTNEEEIIKICKEIDVSKAACLNNLSSTLLKNAFLALSSHLVFLINNIFRTGIFPESWKLATVIPLFKGGNTENVAHFRPVSLLPLPSRIIEKIIHSRISIHLESQDLLDNNQGGFRKKHLTINTIAKLTGDIFDGINNRCMTVC